MHACMHALEKRPTEKICMRFQDDPTTDPTASVQGRPANAEHLHAQTQMLALSTESAASARSDLDKYFTSLTQPAGATRRTSRAARAHAVHRRAMAANNKEGRRERRRQRVLAEAREVRCCLSCFLSHTHALTPTLRKHIHTHTHTHTGGKGGGRDRFEAGEASPRIYCCHFGCVGYPSTLDVRSRGRCAPGCAGDVV